MALPFPERHTRIEISGKLIGIAQDFGIEEKVSVVVHDQPLNMILSGKMLEDHKGWENYSCSAHCLQLCIDKGLNSVRT